MTFAAKLKQLENDHRHRALKRAGGIDFSSNDYLLLSVHPALTEILRNWEGPIGAAGSRLLRGNHPAHEALEDFAAKFFRTEKALYFSTGYQANNAIFSALPQRGDTIIFDALIHASAREAIHHSNADTIKFKHNDLNDLEDVLKRARGEKFIAVESVYSMDGDIAPLKDMLSLCEKYDAYLVIDEAHGTGIFGASGRGLSEGLPHERLITLHTGGKALGVAGGIVCARADIIDYLINTARPFIYSTAPLPVQAALLSRALTLIDEEPWRREKLLTLCKYMNSTSQIIPVIVGEDAAALKKSEELQTAGFDVRAIRPPTVPVGTARLRLSLNIGLTHDILDEVRRHLWNDSSLPERILV